MYVKDVFTHGQPQPEPSLSQRPPPPTLINPPSYNLPILIFKTLTDILDVW